MPEGKMRAFVRSKPLLAGLGIAIVPVLVMVGTARATADETYSADPTAIYTLPATTVGGNPTHPLTSFDISFVDNLAGVYLLADRANASVDVLDLNSNAMRVLSPSNTGCTLPSALTPNCAFRGNPVDPNLPPGGISDVAGPNGEATVNHREIWAGDGPTFQGGAPNIGYTNDNCDSTVKVIDLRTQQVTDVISTGGCFRADEVAFDEDDQVFVVANDAEQDIGNPNFITVISAKPGHAILAKIVFDGTNGTPNATAGIEQPVYDVYLRRFYIAVPADGGTFDNPSSTGAVAVLNPKTGTIVQKLAINNCTPNGIAIGQFSRAVLGCNAAAPVQIINLGDGSVYKTVPQINGGCDEVWYDAGNNHYLTACSQHSTTSPFYVVGVIDGCAQCGSPIWNQNITTKPTSTSGASPHSVAADDFTNRILVPLGMNNPLCGAAITTGCIAAWQSTGDSDDPNYATYYAERTNSAGN
jgi:hypothetical protein